MNLRLIFLIAALTSLVPRGSIACSCQPPDTVAEAVDLAEAVFSGRVIDVVPYSPTPGALHWKVATVEVYAVWKGEPVERITLVSADSAIGCGLVMFEGGEFLFYTEDSWRVDELRENGVEVSSEVSMCLRSMDLFLAEYFGDLEALGDPLAVPNTGKSVSWLKTVNTRH